MALLSRSPEVLAYHEPKPLLGEANVQAFHDLNQNREAYRQLFLQARRRKIQYAYVRGKMYVEHSVMVALMPLIAEVLPQAKFIHVYRHPGAVVRSGMRRGWYQGHEWDRYRVSPGRADKEWEVWQEQWGAFEKNCWFWKRINEEGLRLKAQIGAERVLQLPFEQLVMQSDTVLPKLFDFLRLPLLPQSAIAEELSRRHNVQLENDFPKFADWSVEQKQQLFSIAGDVMKKLDYDLEI